MRACLLPTALRPPGPGTRPFVACRVASCVALALACAAPHAQAQVYKCTGRGNVPVYQDRPCPAGLELRNFAVDPAEVSVLPMPPLPSARSRERTGERSATAEAGASRRASGRAERTRGDPSQRRYLSAGMQEGEVLARAGPPDMKSGGGKASRWTYLPHPADAQTLTTVILEQGKVVDVERKVVR